MEKIVENEEVLRDLLSSLVYTEEEHKKLKRITHMNFFHYSFPFPQEDLWIYTTEAGIYHQFSKFTCITGYTYSICFKNEMPVIKSWAFVLDREYARKIWKM